MTTKNTPPKATPRNRKNMGSKPDETSDFIDPNAPVDEESTVDIFAEDEDDGITKSVEDAVAAAFEGHTSLPLEEPEEPEEPEIDGEPEDCFDDNDDRRSYEAGSYADDPIHQSHHFAFETLQAGPLHIQGIKVDLDKYELRMIRCMDGGQPDMANLAEARANGYEPVPIDLLPADRRAQSAHGGQMGGVYRVKDGILMRRPKWVAKRHVAIERKRAAEKRDAIVRQFETNMPEGARMHSPDFNFEGVTGRQATGKIQQALDGAADQLADLDDAIAGLRRETRAMQEDRSKPKSRARR